MKASRYSLLIFFNVKSKKKKLKLLKINADTLNLNIVSHTHKKVIKND